jgi:diguanylate cyclase (GGDEF)-like protein
MNRVAPSRDPERALPRILDVAVPPRIALLGSLVLLAVIGIGDAITGPYLVFATFYLVPVIATAWACGRTPALVVGALAALSGAVSTAMDPGEVSSPVYVSNGVFRFITYAFVAFLVHAERTAVQTIRELSAVDALTGLANRRHFYALAETELARVRRGDDPLAIAYIDVDDLKHRNDTYGHQAGDTLLVTFAAIAKRTFRATDLLSRLGGDEFCVLMPGLDVDASCAAIDRLTATLEREPDIPILVSVGIVAGVPRADDGVESLVRRADELMYSAKRSGKGQRRTALLGP